MRGSDQRPNRPRKVRSLSPFTPSAAAELAGPDWLRLRRTGAAEAFSTLPLPSPEEEVWRYSRIADLDLSAFAPVQVDSDAHRVSVTELPASWAEQGVVVARASTLTEDVAALGSVAEAGPDVFATLNDAFTADPWVVSVPRGVVLDQPIELRQVIVGPGVAVFPRLIVRMGEGAQATVVDSVTSSGGPVLSVPLTEIDLARGARLRYSHLQDLGTDAWQVGSLVARVGQEADLAAGLVGLGGAYTRLRTDCTLAGRGANGDLMAAYFGSGDQTLDFRTFQHHDAPDTTSNLLFKGAVGGRSRSVYTGLIRVAKEARGTNAFQTNRNVKLSDQAWAESVPNLEIETNDVRCSHASTVGPVDPEQRFYLESRGVPPRIADRLIVAGYFDEVVRDLPGGPAVVQQVRSRIADKLDAVQEDLR